ncbi:MAG: LptF/LptG family permease [Planctomycetota bacterium]|nr:MAG: LptF/LptG family permease [Planctomycetota bacterium]
MTLLLTLGMGAREGLSAGLPPLLISRLIPYLLPEILGITIPVAVLLAVSQVFGRMSGTNEITALKAAGVSPLVTIWPAIFFAFVVSLFTVWMYDLAATWGRPGVKRVIAESIEEIAYGMLKQNRSFASPQFSVAVKSVVGRKLIQPTITIHGRPGSPTVTLTAEEAELWSNKSAGALIIICRKGTIEAEGQVRVQFPDEMRQEIPFEHADRPIHRDWLGTWEVPACVAYLQKQAETIRQRLAKSASNSPQRAAEEQQLRDIEMKIARIRSEPYRRWANGFSSLCFVLIGCPIAIYWRNDNFLAIFFLCFLPVLAIYYPLLMLVDNLIGSPVFVPIMHWMADFGIAVPGIVLLQQVSRY